MINIEELEIWKDYDEKYKVSNLGRVWNKLKDRELKIYTDKVGYCRVSIYGKGIVLHRIVALTFLDNPLNKPTVNHINAIKNDNRVCNLEWATKKEQSQHVREHRLNPNTKYCCVVDDNENIIFNCKSINLLMEQLKLKSSGPIHRSCIGEINTYKGYKIRYWNPEDNSYIKTEYDLTDKKSKGQYNKIIFCELNNKTYISQQECAKDLCITQSTISRSLRGVDSNKYKLKYYT